MRTILIAWELGGGLGHVFPLRPLIAELSARGFRVVFAARDPQLARRYLDGASGVEVLAAPHLDGPVAEPFEPASSYVHLLHNTVCGDVQRGVMLVQEWSELLERERPSLVLADHAPSVLLAARGRNYPVVQWGTGFCCPVPRTPFPSQRPEAALSPGALRVHESQVLSELNVVLSRLGRPLLPALQDLLRTAGPLLSTWPELDHCAELNAAVANGEPPPDRAQAHYLGSWTEVGGARPEWPKGEGKRVFIYAKPGPHLSHTLEMFVRTGQRTLAFVPGSPPTERAADTLRVVSEPVDLRWAAENAAFAVLPGGHASVAHFLRAGVPMLLLPLVLEQRILAERVCELGAAEMADPAQLMEMVKAWIRLNKYTRYRQSAQIFQARYRDYNELAAVKRAADLISALMTLP